MVHSPGNDILQCFRLRHDAVNGRQVPLQQVLALEDPEANVTLKGLSVTSAVNSSQMFTQAALLRKFPAANLALVSGTISAVNSLQM